MLLNEGVGFVKRNMKMLWKKTANSRIEMPNGTKIQERDIDTIASTRR